MIQRVVEKLRWSRRQLSAVSGSVGARLWQSYRQAFPDCVGTSFSHPRPGLTHFDIRKPDLAALRLEVTGHRAVLIASAKPNVGFCEQEPAAAHAVNVAGTLELIRQIGRTGLGLVFLSSDYVFEGTTGQYDDDAPTRPMTQYGRQKVLVEKEIPAWSRIYLVVRLSKVYGVEKNDGTLLDEVSCSLAGGRQIQGAADQFFCPTWVQDVVRAIHSVQELELHGVMNICSPQSWSRYAIALALAQAMDVETSLVKKIRFMTASMKGRPLNTTMVCSRLRKATKVTFTPLLESIRQAARHWKVS